MASVGLGVIRGDVDAYYACRVAEGGGGVEEEHAWFGVCSLSRPGKLLLGL